MNRIGKTLVLAALAAGLVFAFAEKMKHRGGGPLAATPVVRGLPRLVELDAAACAPCKAMVSELEDLRRACADRLVVEVIDVREHRDIEAAYRVRFSPTQIFLDPSGVELYRHEGFMSKGDILAQWRALGFNLEGSGASEKNSGFLSGIFGALGRAVNSAPPLALGAAFLWGLLSVILSPCHLANIPIVIGFIGGQGRISIRRAFGLSCAFAVGALLMIGLIGGITVAAGRLAGDAGPIPNYLVAGMLILVGLHLWDIAPLPWSGRAMGGVTSKGALAALALGLLFGVALGPCTFAYMAPMLGVTFKVASANLAYGALLLLAYGVGHCSVIVLVGTSTEWAQRWLDWNEQSGAGFWLKRGCGAMVLLGGIYLVHAA